MVRANDVRLTSDAALLERLLSDDCAVDACLLEALLAAGLPGAVAARRAGGGRWHLGVALLLGGALALGGAGSAAAREVGAPLAPRPAAAALVPAPLVAPAEAAALVASSPAAAHAALAGTALEPGLVLNMPGLTVDAQQNTTPLSQLYTVVSGDTLSAIALRFYGDASYWPLIYEYNRDIIANPSLIFPGQSLRLTNLPPVATAPLVGTFVPASTSSNLRGQSFGFYTVRAGDSLWSIAQFAYGNPARWVDIYNANYNQIGPDPGLIFSGTVLSMPS